MTRISRIVSDLGIVALAVAASSCAPAETRPSTVAIPELAGRTAGAPQRCVPTQPTEALRVVDSHTALYGGGATIWVNRLATECPGMTRMDILVIEPLGTQYCRGDKVRSVDPVSRIPGPVCVLGDFVPYTR
jgi:hypothetical protein